VPDAITVMIAETRKALEILEEAAQQDAFSNKGHSKLLAELARFIAAVDPLLGLAAATWRADPAPEPKPKEKKKQPDPAK